MIFPDNQIPSVLNSAKIDTPLGPMLALADETSLFMLEFLIKKGLERDLQRFQKRGFTIVDRESAPIKSIRTELDRYFAGRLKEFSTKFSLLGTDFQQKVWQELCKIPYGKTRAYAEQASILSNPKAFRAVANANGKNRLTIIIPCHRVIASDGSLGGYSAGLDNKSWLLEHEKRHYS